MYVSDISGEYMGISVTGEYKYGTWVTILDTSGKPVVGAKVMINAVFSASAHPSAKTYTALTDENGIAAFYVLTLSEYVHMVVDNVSKSGFIYTPEFNVDNDIWIYKE